jgi:hypothetical protein
MRAGAFVRPIPAQQENRPDFARAVFEADVDFGMTAPPSKLDAGAENATIKFRPFLARLAKDPLGVSALIVTMPDFDPVSGLSARLRTRATLELGAALAIGAE